MIDRFIELVRERALPAVAQGQREATIDLLVWTMFADRHVAGAEAVRVAAEARKLAWDAPAPVDEYIGKSMRRARAVLARERSAEEYLDELAQRLADDATRRRALEACEELAAVDGAVATEERELLDKMARHLGLAD